ncbi:MAG: HD domain-containing protein [Thermoplasmata archaeon]|nr:HD domain-containing protein [Thermoplasmata archaeon]
MRDMKDAIKFMDRIKNENLKKHMIAVGAIMEELAVKFGEDREKWKLVGLLHDIDYEEVDMNEHGLKSAEMLKEYLPEDALHAIKSHNELTGVTPESLIDYALIAADAVSGLIVASALVMPNKKLEEVSVKTLKNKYKDKSFARRVDRKRIMYCEKFGMGLDEFLELSLNAMKKVSNQLGL